ncbi:hypothetical protein BHE74_00008415 [Ensete ventricosum]|nr:hypothetical protein BHE74_00008415 [Ensete ventricosum]
MCIIFTRVTHWGIRGGASNPADIKDDASVAIAGGDVGVLPNQRPNYSTVGYESSKARLEYRNGHGNSLARLENSRRSSRSAED